MKNSELFTQIAMQAETEYYSKSIMDCIMEKLAEEKSCFREAILDFWHYSCGRCGFMLYCEIMSQLPSISNGPVISYKL